MSPPSSPKGQTLLHELTHHNPLQNNAPEKPYGISNLPLPKPAVPHNADNFAFHALNIGLSKEAVTDADEGQNYDEEDNHDFAGYDDHQEGHEEYHQEDYYDEEHEMSHDQEEDHDHEYDPEYHDQYYEGNHQDDHGYGHDEEQYHY